MILSLRCHSRLYLIILSLWYHHRLYHLILYLWCHRLLNHLIIHWICYLRVNHVILCRWSNYLMRYLILNWLYHHLSWYCWDILCKVMPLLCLNNYICHWRAICLRDRLNLSTRNFIMSLFLLWIHNFMSLGLTLQFFHENFNIDLVILVIITIFNFLTNLYSFSRTLNIDNRHILICLLI